MARALTVRVDGQDPLSQAALCIRAMSDGQDLGDCPKVLVRRERRDGLIVRVSDEGCAPIPGHHLSVQAPDISG